MRLLLLSLLIWVPDAAFGGSPRAWANRAQDLRLGQDPGWKRLLHYTPMLFGSGSEVSNPEFFLSPAGKKDPEAELEATILALLAPAGAAPDGHAACRFPARAAWISRKLGVPRSELPAVSCPKYDRWLEDLSPNSASLIFASAYLNNPSSMYGHTFLRFDKRGGENSKLLEHAVNFAADTETQNGLLFAVYGLTGFYPGRYSAMPYYLKVQEYSNFESRDLWEYPLNLSTSTLRFLADHIWELQDADFPYYFFNRNCSYQLLPLLEAADPSLSLAPRWPLYVIPADTLRVAARQKGLVREPVYRPARMTTTLHRRGLLKRRELKLAESVAQGGDLKLLDGLTKERRALVLESAGDYLDLKTHFNPRREAEAAQTRRRLLVARGEAGASPPLDVPRPTPPHLGHGTLRAAGGWGFGDRRYGALEVRPGLHDLLDSHEGYARDSTLEMFKLAARYDQTGERAYLQSLDIVRIESFSPRDRWTNKPSWKVDFGLRTAHDIEPRRPWKAGYFGLTLGTGLAFGSGLLGRETAYILGEADAGIGGILRDNHRAGGGAAAGVILEPRRRWKIRAEGAFRAFALGDRRPHARLKLENALELRRELAVRARLERIKENDEAELSLQLYF